MTYEFVELTSQAATAHWGWTIAFFLWFVGLAGMSLFLNWWLRSKRVFYVATVSAVVGTLLVVSHLARMLNLPRAAINALIEWKFNFGSWMFIGICILAVLCVLTVIQAWGMMKNARWADSTGLLMIDAILGVAATAYSGFLLTQAVGVSLWTTASLPILWIFSGLACAVGLAEILASTGQLETGHPKWLGSAANGVHIGEAFVIFAFVQVALSGTPGAVAGAESLLTGANATLFLGGALGLGIVIPLLIGLFMKASKSLVLLGGVCAIAGALALRAAVLFAGYYDPVIF